MKRQIAKILCAVYLFCCLGEYIIPYAAAVSGWVREDSVPDGAKIAGEKWVYDKRTYSDSREPNLSGYELKSSEWVYEGSGSRDYASIPSGFDTGHSIYSQLNHSAYTASETATKRRTVSNDWKGYVYWHWMYLIDGVTEWSTRQFGLKRVFNSYSGYADGYYFTVFRAFLSTNGCQKHWASDGNPMYYDCTAEFGYGKWVDDGQLGFWRFDYYTSTYTDYYKLFHYVRNEYNLESSSPVSPYKNQSEEIYNVRKYVQYENSLTVTFNASGGTVSPASKTVTQGAAYGDLPAPTRANYDFQGWFTASSGGTQITSDTKVNLSGAQTLYARWTYNPVKYTVTFNASGGSVSPTSKTVKDGETYGELPKPKRKNYDFAGWHTAADGGEEVTSGTPVRSGAHTLYAHWVYNPATYVVIYNPMGGTVDPISKSVQDGEPYGDLPTPERGNYQFDGWFTAPDGGTRITGDTKVSLSDNQTLYAHWTYVPPTYTVTFNANGGGGSMTPRRVADDGQFTFPKCGFTPPSPDGRFTGWTANGILYQTGDTVTLSDNAEAVAQWSGYDIGGVTTNGGKVTVKLVYALSASVSVVACTYAEDGKLLASAFKAVDSGASAELSLQTSGAAYLKAFLINPKTNAPLCNPFQKKL